MSMQSGIKSRVVFSIGATVLLSVATCAQAAEPSFQFRASNTTTFAADCNGVAQTGNLFPNAEVEPFIAVNPRFPLNVIGVWQQDRWSNGGSQGLGTGVSFDGGISWRQQYVPYTRCAGGNASNGGDYERGSDPWVSFSPNGVAHQMVLTLNNQAPGATALLVSRSTDGGLNWSKPITLLRNTSDQFFNDKNSITADSTDSRYVYAIWDRLATTGGGPTFLARSVDNGKTWEEAKPIYDPGPTTQTIGNQIVVLPDGVLVNFFTQIDQTNGNAFFAVIRSSDKGKTWSQAFKIADTLSVGTADPETGQPVRDGSGIGTIAVGKRGELYVAFADGSFSNFARDDIAFSSSTDGGQTWSAPTRINVTADAPAFTPAIHVRNDGTIGVSFFDFRSNSADSNTLPTEYWLLRSRDGGTTWRESKVTGPFNLNTAPIARGYFLGDYMGLTSIGPLFVPFYAKTTGDLNNRNDIFSALALTLGRNKAEREEILKRDEEEEMKLPAQRAVNAAVVAPQMSAQVKQRQFENYTRMMQARVPVWDEWQAKRKSQ